MADEPDNIFLQYLGRFDQKLDRAAYRTATQQWVNTEMRRLGVSAPDGKARKT